MRVLSLAVAVALISVGCGGDDSPTAPTAVSSVTVAPANPNETVFIGQTTQFEATSTLKATASRICELAHGGLTTPTWRRLTRTALSLACRQARRRSSLTLIREVPC